ncbi:hypothetical protein AVEN_183047-1 [Araneus ventricosus]|uniref:Uncharacterized protein n=1 Tax=Araneus ventricosus TaxID=182803 RepID=A0A4Y2EX43_ARAVE|nr:hypothetical protein AVEN_183047-1 [Araneus ventricosus]
MPRSVENRRSNAKSNLSEETLRMRGYWCFKCDSERSSPRGLSEADMIWSALRNLLKENQETFQFSPSKYHFSKGYSIIRCYTPDYSDRESILKVATVIRERIDFPYIIDYYRVNNAWKCIYRHTHAGELYKKVKKNWKLCN